MSIAFFHVVSRCIYFCLNGFHLLRILNFVMLLCSCYRICSRNLHTFFSILAAEKSGCVKYVFFWGGRGVGGEGLDVGFIPVVLRNLSLLICTMLYNYYSSFQS